MKGCGDPPTTGTAPDYETLRTAARKSDCSLHSFLASNPAGRAAPERRSKLTRTRGPASSPAQAGNTRGNDHAQDATLKSNPGFWPLSAVTVIHDHSTRRRSFPFDPARVLVLPMLTNGQSRLPQPFHILAQLRQFHRGKIFVPARLRATQRLTSENPVLGSESLCDPG